MVGPPLSEDPKTRVTVLTPGQVSVMSVSRVDQEAPLSAVSLGPGLVFSSNAAVVGGGPQAVDAGARIAQPPCHNPYDWQKMPRTLATSMTRVDNHLGQE
jgi:hypothetical protein